MSAANTERETVPIQKTEVSIAYASRRVGATAEQLFYA